MLVRMCGDGRGDGSGIGNEIIDVRASPLHQYSGTCPAVPQVSVWALINQQKPPCTSAKIFLSARSA